MARLMTAQTRRSREARSRVPHLAGLFCTGMTQMSADQHPPPGSPARPPGGVSAAAPAQTQLPPLGDFPPALALISPLPQTIKNFPSAGLKTPNLVGRVSNTFKGTSSAEGSEGCGVGGLGGEEDSILRPQRSQPHQGPFPFPRREHTRPPGTDRKERPWGQGSGF